MRLALVGLYGSSTPSGKDTEKEFVMPHRIGFLYDEIVNEKNIADAWSTYNKRRPVFLRKDYDPAVAKDILLKMKSGTVSFGQVREKTIIENGKERRLRIPDFKSCIAQTSIALVVAPILDARLNGNSFSSRPGYGMHKCARKQQRLLQTNKKDSKYMLYFDIRKCYDHIRHEDVIKSVERVIKDRRVISMIADVLEYGGPGLPIGFPMSHIFANLVLDRLYRVIVGIKGVCKAYVYMDNFGVYSRYKSCLKRVRQAASDWLRLHGMEMKNDWQIFPTDKRPVKSCGFVLSQDSRPKTYRKIFHRIRRNIDRFCHDANRKLALGIASRVGWLRETNRSHVLLDEVSWDTVKEFLV